MSGEVGKQAGMSAASSAAAGASLGTAIMPGWGTAIGAVIGAVVGGVAGAFQGSKQKKAKRYAKMAAAIQKQREENKDYETFLQMIRQQRIARASTLATAVASGLNKTSAVSGAISGQQSQTAHSINFLAEDRRLQELYLNYMKKAGKNVSISKDIGSALALSDSLVMSAGSIYGKFGGGSGGGTQTQLEEPNEMNTMSAGGTFTNNPQVWNNYYNQQYFGYGNT